jgi:hypothetical protein
MTLTKTIDHVTEAQNNLIELFKNKPKWLAVVKAFVGEIQDAEDSNWDLYNDFLDTAEGDSLDAYGATVGEDRDERSDDDYRAAIRARILLNLGNGTPEDIIALLHSVSDGGNVRIREYFPAAFTAFVLKAVDLSTALRMNTALQSGKPAGVLAHLIYTESDPDDLFQFDLGPGYDQGKWAGVLDPDAEVFLVRSRADLFYLKSRDSDRPLIAR